MAGTFGFGLFHGLGFASAMGDMAINTRFPALQQPKSKKSHMQNG
jgi:hypothetical protein